MVQANLTVLRLLEAYTVKLDRASREPCLSSIYIYVVKLMISSLILLSHPIFVLRQNFVAKFYNIPGTYWSLD